MPASTFWSVHVLPARPAEIDVDPRQVDVKHSTHRSVKAFLKAHVKEGLLKLKGTLMWSSLAEGLLLGLLNHMQRWYEIRVEGKDAVRKKGQLKLIQVILKIRQERKACTLVTGFEPYTLDAEELVEELRKIYASSTSVSPVQDKASEMEVMVQGKQIKAVPDLLIAKSVLKRWIESADLSAEKKKEK